MTATDADEGMTSEIDYNDGEAGEANTFASPTSQKEHRSGWLRL